jgi:hypothetical protein
MLKDYFEKIVKYLSPELQTKNMQRIVISSVFALGIDPYTTDPYEMSVLKKFADKLSPENNVFLGDKRLFVDKINQINDLLSSISGEGSEAVGTISEILLDLKLELRDRSSRIYNLTYLANNYANEQNFGMPIQNAEEIIESLRSDLIMYDLGYSQKKWPHIKAKGIIALNDLLAYYNVLLLLEETGKLYLETIPEGQTVIAGILEYFLTNINNSYIHLVYVEHCFANEQIPIEQRGFEHKTTRLKLFYEKDLVLYQIRVDLPHKGEEYPHINLHSAEIGDNTFSRSEHYPLADTPLSNTLLHALEERLHATPLQLVDWQPQLRNEKDEDIIKLLTMKICTRGIQQYYAKEKIFDSETRGYLWEFLTELSSDYEDPALRELLTDDEDFLAEVIAALGKRFKEFYLA